MPGAPSSVLVTSSKAVVPSSDALVPSSKRSVATLFPPKKNLRFHVLISSHRFLLLFFKLEDALQLSGQCWQQLFQLFARGSSSDQLLP